MIMRRLSVLLLLACAACGGVDEEVLEQTEDELLRYTLPVVEPIDEPTGDEPPDLGGGLNECEPGTPGCFCWNDCGFKTECRVRCALCSGSCNNYNGRRLNDVDAAMSVDVAGGAVDLDERFVTAEGVRFFAASISDGAGTRPFCRGGREVIVVPGTWDPREGVAGGGAKRDFGTTLACRGSAIAKCVEGGYRPWESAAADLAHQACVRAMRADFCGDGRSWTQDGVAISLEPRGYVSSLSIEALWSADGALLIASPRGDVPACDRVAAGTPLITTRLF